ncbi:hypothetical protein Krad_2281 [Kineococcus radiotolerans SRS30216 = ATCC BAA-149]|uniref:Uncharacterized protein n=1 Tax=Kineococcus radiotolerans (strain ATCC BAA-149 / DSM 14245 / SRS30216) TaxID=266940 RepID=A6WAC3_KINRD|nr:hypothetical protein Krad_2281 [Kineococcus radiotolerans SRS30216 = ATCC BAA-149]
MSTAVRGRVVRAVRLCKAPKMADFPWSRASVVHALGERVLTEGAVTRGFTGIDVRPALTGELLHLDAVHEHVVVVLRWQQDPGIYAIAIPLLPAGAYGDAGLPPGMSTGLPVTSLPEWVEEVALWLMEEFDTGLVRRATRIQVGDLIFLTADGGAADVAPEGYYVSTLHLGPGGGRGEHLADVGLDVSTARRILSSGRLLTWLHAYVDNGRGEPFIGHAVVARAPADPGGNGTQPARLEVLEIVPGTPGTVAAALVYHAVRDAIESGAETVSSTLDDPALEKVGFRRHGSGYLSLSWRDVQIPDLRR